MKKLIILSILSIFVLGAAQNVTAQTNKNVLGEWKFSAPSAPYGYEKGTITISEKEGELEGEVKFGDGYKMALKKVTVEKETLSFSLYVDYENVEVKAKVEDKKMKGDANTSQGKLPFTAEKIVKK